MLRLLLRIGERAYLFFSQGSRALKLVQPEHPQLELAPSIPEILPTISELSERLPKPFIR